MIGSSSSKTRHLCMGVQALDLFLKSHFWVTRANWASCERSIETIQINDSTEQYCKYKGVYIEIKLCSRL